jgi:type II secretory pathway component PulF
MNMEVRYPAFSLRRTSWAQRQSLLRLILVSIDENLPLGPLIVAWAADESGIQQHRLDRLAELLRAGTPLPEAVEEVPGVLSDEDMLAIRFGAQSGTLAASIRERVNEPSPASSGFSPRMRKLRFYVCLLLFVGFFIVAFWQIRIVPELEKIMVEFSVSDTELLKWSRTFSLVFANYWFLFALAIIVVFWLAFSSWPGRRLRLAILGRLFRPLRALHMADVLEKLSVAIQAGRPITGSLSTLARYHFDPTLRHQLLFIRNEMEQGADVWQSMASIGLLSPPEVHVLETADRVGNRPWVLKQIALVKRRRTMRRLEQLSELALPVVILLAGSFVLIQALGLFGPLVHILDSLL